MSETNQFIGQQDTMILKGLESYGELVGSFLLAREFVNLK
jgi:hypothetical protein